MATSWHLAPSLALLTREINARWPNRDKTTDGTIGDPAHSARVSDHNPNERESVNARDTDEDGIDSWGLVGLLIKDPRVNYVIYERRIWQRKHNFVPRAYTGLNAHEKHVHVSIIQSETAEQDVRPWGVARIGIAGGGVAPTTPSTTTTPTTTGGLSMSDIKEITAALAAIQTTLSGKNGVNAKLEAVATGTYSRAALDRDAAATASIVKAAVNASTASLLAAVSKTGALSASDLAQVTEAAEKGVTDAIDGATLQLKAGA